MDELYVTMVSVPKHASFIYFYFPLLLILGPTFTIGLLRFQSYMLGSMVSLKSLFLELDLWHLCLRLAWNLIDGGRDAILAYAFLYHICDHSCSIISILPSMNQITYLTECSPCFFYLLTHTFVRLLSLRTQSSSWNMVAKTVGFLFYLFFLIERTFLFLNSVLHFF